jgi:hypothetical protein
MPGHVAIDSKIESNSDAITSNQKASLKIAGAISIEATGTADPNSVVRSGKAPPIVLAARPIGSR